MYTHIHSVFTIYIIYIYTTNRRYKFASTPPTDLLTSEAAADINQTGKVAATLELLATERTAGLSHIPYPSHNVVLPSPSLSRTLPTSPRISPSSNNYCRHHRYTARVVVSRRFL